MLNRCTRFIRKNFQDSDAERFMLPANSLIDFFCRYENAIALDKEGDPDYLPVRIAIVIRNNDGNLFIESGAVEQLLFSDYLVADPELHLARACLKSAERILNDTVSFYDSTGFNGRVNLTGRFSKETIEALCVRVGDNAVDFIFQYKPAIRGDFVVRRKNKTIGTTITPKNPFKSKAYVGLKVKDIPVLAHIQNSPNQFAVLSV